MLKGHFICLQSPCVHWVVTGGRQSRWSMGVLCHPDSCLSFSPCHWNVLEQKWLQPSFPCCVLLQPPHGAAYWLRLQNFDTYMDAPVFCNGTSICSMGHSQEEKTVWRGRQLLTLPACPGREEKKGLHDSGRHRTCIEHLLCSLLEQPMWGLCNV